MQKKSFNFVTFTTLNPTSYFICFTNWLTSLNLLSTSAIKRVAPGFKTLLASTKKSGKLVPISDRLKTPMSSTSSSSGTFAMSVQITCSSHFPTSKLYMSPQWPFSLSCNQSLPSPHPKSPISEFTYFTFLSSVTNMSSGFLGHFSTYCR